MLLLMPNRGSMRKIEAFVKTWMNQSMDRASVSWLCRSCLRCFWCRVFGRLVTVCRFDTFCNMWGEVLRKRRVAPPPLKSLKSDNRRAPQKPGTMFLLEFLFARFCGPGKEKLLKFPEPWQFLYPDCSRFLPSSFRTQNLEAMMHHVSQYYYLYRNLYISMIGGLKQEPTSDSPKVLDCTRCPRNMIFLRWIAELLFSQIDVH